MNENNPTRFNAILSLSNNGFLSDLLASSGWIDVFVIPQEKLKMIKHLFN